MATILVTGGSGFIGSNFVLQCRAHDWYQVINLDKLTYASNPHSLTALAADPGYHFVHGDIGDQPLVTKLLDQFKPTAIVNFAAESHVDRSILAPDIFIQTNIVGTHHLLRVSRDYWQHLSSSARAAFRFLHVSTDEVYGALSLDDPPFSEQSPYAPNSPYAASKASADHLVRAYYQTYGLPTLTTNSSNNYGPRQFPEKLIPLVILNALAEKPLPLYGEGQNIRDWLYVNDHCCAIHRVLVHGTIGETYNIGGNCEHTNLEVVELICQTLEQLAPKTNLNYKDLITFIADRPGHDLRYALNCEKIEAELGWVPQETFATGLYKTINWYLNHPQWVQVACSRDYEDWITQHYGNPV